MLEIAQSYTTLAALANVHLEDSFVLGIREEHAHVDFVLDIALLERHPRYATPPEGDRHCYCQAVLRFENVSRSDWAARSVVPTRDASGEVDYGNIDSFVLHDRVHHLTGDWGAVTIESDPPTLLFLAEERESLANSEEYRPVPTFT